MNITQEKNKLTLTSQLTSGHKYVHVVQQVALSATEVLDSNITDSESEFTLPNDGYYILSEILLPTTNGTSNYWTDGIYIYDPFDDIISVETLLEVDPSVTNIIREDFNYISKYMLDKYYEELLKATFLKDMCNCNCRAPGKVELPTLTMGIDLIDLLIETGQFYEAQRIIEKLTTCIGITELNCRCNG